MTYESVDQLQKMLTTEVFHYAKDSKKAAGRALGTLVEVITFYLLKTWGYEASVSIERGLSEYGNPKITHNVEYSLHPIISQQKITIKKLKPPVSVAKIMKAILGKINLPKKYKPKNQVLITKQGVLRNACTLAVGEDEAYVCLIEDISKKEITLNIVKQYRSPYSMFECKRVGVEEGNKKGPQTIEKAKQGAYVAKTVSSLQRVRSFTGELYGVIPKQDGSLYVGPYDRIIEEIVSSSSPEYLSHFVLTVGVVSNHGNWFTAGNQNKELMVLAQSYDWLLFLSDQGLSEFIRDVLIRPSASLAPARKAFINSYSAHKKKNQFTKVQMHIDADRALLHYFKSNIKRIERWFNIITPAKEGLNDLRRQIDRLSQKDWKRILRK